MRASMPLSRHHAVWISHPIQTSKYPKIREMTALAAFDYGGKSWVRLVASNHAALDTIQRFAAMADFLHVELKRCNCVGERASAALSAALRTDPCLLPLMTFCRILDDYLFCPARPLSKRFATEAACTSCRRCGHATGMRRHHCCIAAHALIATTPSAADSPVDEHATKLRSNYTSMTISADRFESVHDPSPRLYRGLTSWSGGSGACLLQIALSRPTGVRYAARQSTPALSSILWRRRNGRRALVTTSATSSSTTLTGPTCRCCFACYCRRLSPLATCFPSVRGLSAWWIARLTMPHEIQMQRLRDKRPLWLLCGDWRSGSTRVIPRRSGSARPRHLSRYRGPTVPVHPDFMVSPIRLG